MRAAPAGTGVCRGQFARPGPAPRGACPVNVPRTTSWDRYPGIQSRWEGHERVAGHRETSGALSYLCPVLSGGGSSKASERPLGTECHGVRSEQTWLLVPHWDLAHEGRGGKGQLGSDSGCGGCPSLPAQPWHHSPVVGAPYRHPGVVPQHLVYVPLGEGAGSGAWASR